MMKKWCVCILTAALACTGAVSDAGISLRAESMYVVGEEVVSETTEFFEDGSSLTITVTQEAGVMAYGSVYSQSGAKTYVFRDAKNKEVCRFKVHGTFSVNSGVSATCTDTSYSTSITDTSWELVSASTYASGNQAIGDAIFSQKQNGSTVDTKSCHVVLTCDENGKLK